MRNLVLSPLFTNLEHWTPDPFVTDGVASLSARSNTSLTGTCDAPKAGDPLNVSVKLTGPVKMRVSLLQGGTTLSTVTTLTAPTAATVVTLTAIAGSDAPVTLVVALAESYSGYASFTVADPQVIAPDLPVIPITPDALDLEARVAVLVPDDPQLIAEAVSIVTESVRAYTRDTGFGDEGLTGYSGKALASVIVTAAARMVSNPEQTTYEAIGDTQSKPGLFDGFTLAELIILNRYRKRAW